MINFDLLKKLSFYFLALVCCALCLKKPVFANVVLEKYPHLDQAQYYFLIDADSKPIGISVEDTLQQAVDKFFEDTTK